MLFEFIAKLVKDPEGAPPPEVDEDFEEQQNMVARLIHTSLKGPTLAEHFKGLKGLVVPTQDSYANMFYIILLHMIAGFTGAQRSGCTTPRLLWGSKVWLYQPKTAMITCFTLGWK
eukprot:5919283-Pyramimonas_sp.AAC.1